jgi:pimeloyl-ACP methyl ester carboxylesterase
VAKGLHYRIFGAGYTTVYLHGFLESSTMWEPLDLVNQPGKHLLIDLPGHGKSPLIDDTDSPSIRFMAEEVVRVLKELNITEYRVLGHSMGGYVALELFNLRLEIPSLLQHVTLINSNCWEDNEIKKVERLKIVRIAYKAKNLFINEVIPNLFARAHDFYPQIEALKKEAKRMSSDSIAYATLAIRNRNDYTALVLSNPECFTFIHGALDRLVSMDDIQSRLILPKGASPKIIILPSAGHMAHWERKKELIDILYPSQE